MRAERLYSRSKYGRRHGQFVEFIEVEDKKLAQLSQRDRATLRLIEYFFKSPNVTQDHSK